MKVDINSQLRTEGDINFSEARKSWAERNNDPATKSLLAADARYFLHQSLSTPCLDVLKSCDWIIDLGPEAGDEGGKLVFAGKPAELKKIKGSYTARFL